MGNTDLRFYLTILQRRFPYLLAIVALLTGIGIIVAVLMPPVYKASARILVEPPLIAADMARPTVEADAIEQMQIIQQDITTRDRLLDLAKRRDVYGEKRASLSDADVVDNMRARVVLEQVATDRAPAGRGATIFSVSFTAREPELAAAVVNDLVGFILSQNMDLRATRAGDTMQFFKGEVARLGDELSRQEQAVLQFKNSNKGALPDSIDFRRLQQTNQQERLLLLEREESALRVRRNNLVRMFEATGQVATAGPISPEQAMLRDLNRALAEQLSIFSENSPNVAMLRQRISALQSSDKSDAAAEGNRGPTDLDMQLSDLEERLEFITREKGAIARNLADLAVTIDATPQNETQLNALQRSRDNIQLQYNAAVAKLAQASIGEQIEIGSKAGRFSVVEPALPPQSKVSPNRRRIAAAGMAGGIIFGLGFVVLLELANRTIRRPRELSEMLQQPLLATIPYIWAPGETRSRRRRLAMGFAAAATVAAATGIAVQTYRQPLADKFENLIVALDARKMM